MGEADERVEAKPETFAWHWPDPTMGRITQARGIPAESQDRLARLRMRRLAIHGGAGCVPAGTPRRLPEPRRVRRTRNRPVLAHGRPIHGCRSQELWYATRGDVG